MQRTLEDLMGIYLGSDGRRTKALYDELEMMGSAGTIAVNLFRACKASERAKVYRGRGYTGQAYQKKDWSLDNLHSALIAYGAEVGITFGWGRDPKAIGFEHVLYVDLPTGQVSFHLARRFGGGPDYAGTWDGIKGEAPIRICRWVEKVTMGDSNGR